MPAVFLSLSQFRASRPLLLAVIVLIALPAAAFANQKERLAPKFIPGEIFHYQIESHTTTTVKTTTPIADPESGSRTTQALDLIVRLDVLSPAPGSPPGATHFRVTYEKSHAEAESDAFDPTGPTFEDQYNRIEGRSFDFTLDPNGTIAISGASTGIFRNRSTAEPPTPDRRPFSRQPLPARWRFRRPEVEDRTPGHRHAARRSHLVERFHLSGQRALQRDGRRRERQNRPEIRQSAHRATCAMILMHYHMSRRGSPKSDATPPDYRKNGLRTSGAWTGSGDSLDSISLATRLLVTFTENSTQQVDYEITSATSGSSVRRKGRVQSQLIITLIPDSN